MSPRTAALIAQQMMLLRAARQQLTVAEQQVLRDVALRLEQVDEVLHACHDEMVAEICQYIVSPDPGPLSTAGGRWRTLSGIAGRMQSVLQVWPDLAQQTSEEEA